MQRVELPSGKAAFPIALSEVDVRRLCGAAAFARGDDWQRADHVIDPRAGERSLRASVQGTWRRLDEVQATIESGQIKTACTCNVGPFCRHAAALLLDWLREPTSFIADETDPSAENAGGQQLNTLPGATLPPLDVDADGINTPDTSEMADRAELAQLLDLWSTTTLRTLAKQRNVRVVARNKIELVEQLSIALLKPKNIDDALASLEEDELLMLFIVDILNAAHSTEIRALQMSYQALGGASDSQSWSKALSTLHRLGLAIRNDTRPIGSNAYIVPPSIALRLRNLPGSITPGAPSTWSIVSNPPRVAESRPPGLRLTIHELLQIVGQALTRGEVGTTLRTFETSDMAHALPGWMIDPRDRNPSGSSSGTAVARYHQRDLRVVPMAPILIDADRQYLAQATGQPVYFIDFAVWLLVHLGILVRRDLSLELEESSLRTIMALPWAARLGVLTSEWISGSDAAELSSLTGEGKRLELHFNPSYMGWGATPPRGGDVRNLVVRIVMHLDYRATDRWYDFASLLDVLWKLDRTALNWGMATDSRAPWWFVDTTDGADRLDLATREDWERVWGPLLGYILNGPMSWLGLVETQAGTDGSRAFRLRPAAGILHGHAEQEPQSATLLEAALDDSVGGDPVIVVPQGFSSGEVFELLARYGEFMSVTESGLRYRLPRERLQMAFDDGVTGPELIELLTRHTGGALLSNVRAKLESWWSTYGSIRLYDELTLIELADDTLLRELLAISTLGEKLVHTFSPRIVAVDPATVDSLIAEFTRLGHTPRISETS